MFAAQTPSGKGGAAGGDGSGGAAVGAVSSSKKKGVTLSAKGGAGTARYYIASLSPVFSLRLLPVALCALRCELLDRCARCF